MKNKIMTMTFTRSGEAIDVSTKIHEKVSGKELMETFKTAIRGMIESSTKVGIGFGMSEGEVYNFLFDLDTKES